MKASSTSIAAERKRDVSIDRAVVLDHVVEQHAEIRLVDADGVLHRLGRQADLVADDRAALGALDAHPFALDGVGILDGDVGVRMREDVDRIAAFLGFLERMGQALDQVGCKHGVHSSSATPLRSVPMPGDSTSTTSPGFSQPADPGASRCRWACRSGSGRRAAAWQRC
jgi:hypothetical protein